MVAGCGRELRFAARFLLLFGLLHYAYAACHDSPVEHFAIEVATVRPSVALIDWLAPDARAMASGHRILAPGGSLSILNGCEGTETMFLMIAAVVAFPACWRKKLAGGLLGSGLIYLLNQARIVALFVAARESRHWFDLLHGYVAPTLIIVLGCLYFLWWADGDKPAHPA